MRLSAQTSEGLGTFVDAGSNTAAWYESKTQAVLEKYGGCGSRVHYHTGPTSWPTETSVEGITKAMWRAQEEELREAFASCRAHVDVSGRFLDVGCGLGGTMQWLRDELGVVHVEGLTIAPSHASVARQLGGAKGHNLVVHVGDAAEWIGGTYDVICAFQASNLFKRAHWFPRLARMLKRGGLLLIDDYFSCDPTFNPLFDAAFASNIGTRVEYLRLAEDNGFVWVVERDHTELSAPFWELCARYSEVQSGSGWHQPATFHRGMYRAQAERRCEHRLLAFIRR